jgi:hypothetical protein
MKITKNQKTSILLYINILFTSLVYNKCIKTDFVKL